MFLSHFKIKCVFFLKCFFLVMLRSKMFCLLEVVLCEYNIIIIFLSYAIMGSNYEQLEKKHVILLVKTCENPVQITL